MFLAHLRTTLGIRGVKRVTLHERMTALRRIAIVTVEKGTPRTEVWRALYGATSFKADCGKICIAVNDDIDPDNSDALFWAIAFRMNPANDLQVLPYRSPGHGPEREHEAERARRRDAAHGRDDEGGAAAARAAEAGIHGARAQDLGRAGAAEAAPAVAVVRRAASATGCRSGTRARSARPKAATWRTAASARSCGGRA